MEASPYKISGPTVIHFSGGRTSAYMLRMALDYNGGRIPDGSHVVFCNTGKERSETLDFVRDVSARWNVNIVWLEYRNRPTTRKGKKGWEHYAVEVDHATSSRNGEPFEMVILARNFLPNVTMRFCTIELKIKTCGRWLKQKGVGEYASWVGLRADEPKRVAKLLRKGETCVRDTLLGPETVHVRGAETLPGELPVCPLADAGVTVRDVERYWLTSRVGVKLNDWLATPVHTRRGFDLALRPDEGNCDLCFLKGTAKRLRLIEERPESADWWAKMESLRIGVTTSGAGWFRKPKDGPDYAALKMIAQKRYPMPLLDDDDASDMCVNCTD